MINNTRLKLTGWITVLVGFFTSFLHMSPARSQATPPPNREPSSCVVTTAMQPSSGLTAIQIPSSGLTAIQTPSGDTINLRFPSVAVSLEKYFASEQDWMAFNDWYLGLVEDNQNPATISHVILFKQMQLEMRLQQAGY